MYLWVFLFLLLIASFIPLWLWKMSRMLSIFLNLISLLCDIACNRSCRIFHMLLRRMYINTIILILWEKKKKTVLVDVSLLILQSFLLTQYTILFFSDLKVSSRKYATCLTEGSPLCMISCFSLAAFKVLPLILTVDISITIHLGVDSLGSTYLSR